MRARTHHTYRASRGFTLIEVLVVIGMIAILAAIVLIAINPLRQFAEARNSQRSSDTNALLNAIGQRIADNRGVFADTESCPNALPASATVIKKTGGYDLRPCLVPTYISELPTDPSTGTDTCTDADCTSGTYSTDYTVMQNASTSRITICAPGAAETAITGSEAYCLTR